jgi:hypothetical protein
MSNSPTRLPAWTLTALIISGAALIVMSMFFPIFPWAGVSHFSVAWANFEWSDWQGWRMQLILWPEAFALLEGLLCLAATIHPAWARKAYNWLGVALFLGTVATLQLVLFWWYRGMAAFLIPHDIVAWSSAACAVFALLALPAAPLTHAQRSHIVRLVGCAWILAAFFPIWPLPPLRDLLRLHGPAYCMLIGGALMMAIGSVGQLRRATLTVPP